MSAIWVSFLSKGPDAVDFADYMITNDFKNAPVGKAVYSPLCTQEGKVIDDLICYKISNERVLVCVNASNIEKDFLGSQNIKINL